MSAVIRRIPAGVISAVVALLLWQLVGTVGPLAGDSFATATEAIGGLLELMGTADFWSAFLATLQMAVIGFLIAVAIGIPVGLLIGLSRFSYRSSKFVFDFFKVIPPIVIIPITILVIGPNLQMGIFLVAFANVFAIAIQTAYGVRDTDPVLLDTMRSYRMSVAQQLRFARLPSAAVQIAISLRLAAAASIVVAVVAGLVGGAPGLGQLLSLMQSSGNAAGSYGIVLFLGLVGIAFSRLIIRTQRRVVFWSGK